MIKRTLDVLVTTYEADRELRLCLEGFCNQQDPDFHIYVVNDGGKDKAEQVVDEFRSRLSIDYLYLGPPSPDFRLAKTRNLGLSRCTADRVLTIDGDCVPSRFVTAKHRMAGKAPIILSGLRRRWGESCWPSLTPENLKTMELIGWAPECRHETHSEFQLRAFKETRYHNVCWGMHVSFPRRVLQKLGGWNEKFVGYGAEDEELCLRMIRQGCSIVYRPDLIVYHLDHPPRRGAPENRQYYNDTVYYRSEPASQVPDKVITLK